MGTIAHHAIIVTGSSESIERAREKAVEIFKVDPEDHELFNRIMGHPVIAGVTNIVASGVNGYDSFMVAPDGSKEGWGLSDEGDKRRKELLDWLEAQGRYDYAEVQYS